MKIITKQPVNKSPFRGKKKAAVEEVEEVAPPVAIATRAVFRVELYIPPGMNHRDVHNWVQKYFSFFHPSLDAKVTQEESA